MLNSNGNSYIDVISMFCKDYYVYYMLYDGQSKNSRINIIYKLQLLDLFGSLWGMKAYNAECNS